MWEEIFHAPQTCHWCFEFRKALLNAPGGVLSHTSNGEAQIQRMGFFLKLLGGIIPTHFNFPYKVNRDITSPFSQVFRFQRYHTHKLFSLSLRYRLLQLLFFSQDTFETFSLSYHRLSYTLVSVNLHFFKHILFFSAALLDCSFLPFFIYRIRSFYFRFAQMGRFESLIDSPLKIELFKQKYYIPQ